MINDEKILPPQLFINDDLLSLSRNDFMTQTNNKQIPYNCKYITVIT